MKRQLFILFFLLQTVLIFGQNLVQNSTGSFTYTPHSPLNNQKVKVYYHIPSGDITTMPIVMSFHGASRNADDYRDYWISMANENEFMVFAPEFSADNYPGLGDNYLMANIFDDGDNPSPETFNNTKEWTFSVIDPLFDYIKADLAGKQLKYNAWGHSGGAQFLHRFVIYMPDSKLNVAVCSNAGWYTVPENTVSFPYGIFNGQLPDSDLKSAFSKKLIVHLGQDDTDPNSSGLRHNTVVDNQQGLFRLERGQYFYNTAQITAQNMSTEFNWEKHEVAGIAHQAQLMANDALKYIVMNTSISTGSYEPINIYPNPTNLKYINISDTKQISTTVIIYDILGKQLINKAITSYRINLSELNAGSYIVEILSQKTKLFSKLLIVK